MHWLKKLFQKPGQEAARDDVDRAVEEMDKMAKKKKAQEAEATYTTPVYSGPASFYTGPASYYMPTLMTSATSLAALYGTGSTGLTTGAIGRYTIRPSATGSSIFFTEPEPPKPVEVTFQYMDEQMCLVRMSDGTESKMAYEEVLLAGLELPKPPPKPKVIDEAEARRIAEGSGLWHMSVAREMLLAWG